jgi:DNA-binding CsgD family transcriptional regulator/GAF domain-containing protein
MSSTTADLVEEHTHPGKPPDIPGTVRSLTPRQREVLALIGQGLSTAEIARRLYRTVKTVESHRLMLGKRLGARNRVELARIAIQAGLTDLGPPGEGVSAQGTDPDAVAQEGTCRALGMIEAGVSTAHGQAFLEAMVSQIVTALGAAGAFVLRVGAEGVSKSVVGWTQEGRAGEVKYTAARAEDAGLAGGEVREIEGAPMQMFGETSPVMYREVASTLLTPLYDSRGQRLGTLAVLLRTAPEQAVCTREILRLLAGRAAAELERKEAEDRFNHLQSLVSSAADRIGLWERDLRNDKLTWSAETYRIMGFEPHAIVPTRERFFSMVHPQDRERVMDAGNEALRQGAASAIEYRVIRPDGDERTILACYQAAPDITGRPGWVFGTMKDITQE